MIAIRSDREAIQLLRSRLAESLLQLMVQPRQSLFQTVVPLLGKFRVIQVHVAEFAQRSERLYRSIREIRVIEMQFNERKPR